MRVCVTVDAYLQSCCCVVEAWVVMRLVGATIDMYASHAYSMHAYMRSMPDTDAGA